MAFQPLRAAGLTQASRVMAPVKSRLLESLTVTQLLLPLKDRAPPNLPAVQVAALTVPLLPLPEESPTAVPEPSSKPRAATRVFELDTVTLTPADGTSRLPLSSTALLRRNVGP